jgi:hypothetical protein
MKIPAILLLLLLIIPGCQYDVGPSGHLSSLLGK